MDYAVDTHGMLCRIGDTQTRDEVFWGQKTDVSKCVPFYAEGWSHVTPDEMKYLQKHIRGRIKDKARNVRMLGYTNPYRLPDITSAAIYVKNGYQCWVPATNTIIIRSDCYFKGYPSDMTSILHSDSDKRQLEIDDKPTVDAEPYKFMEIPTLAHRADDPDSWKNMYKNKELVLGLGGVASRVTRSSSRNASNPSLSLPIVESPSGVVIDPSTITTFDNTKNKNNKRVKFTYPNGESADTVHPSKKRNVSVDAETRWVIPPSTETRYTTVDPDPVDTSPRRTTRKPVKKTIKSMLTIFDDDSPKLKKIKTRLNKLIRDNKRAEQDSWTVDTDRRDAYYASRARNHVNITTKTPTNKLEIRNAIDRIRNLIDKNNNKNSKPSVTPVSKRKKDRPPNSDVLNPPPDLLVDKILEEYDVDPKNLLDAFNGPDGQYWLLAYEQEMERLGVRGTWTIVDDFIGSEKLDPDKPIKSKFAFRRSVRPDGTLKFRCRLVACGYAQIPGKDYDENYSPTAKYKSLCMILHIAAVLDWHIAGIDVENAFVEAKIDKEIHMYLPKDVFLKDSGRRVKVRLNKSLYGLKQAGDLWNKLVNKQFIDMGFRRLAHDQCVYVNKDIDTGVITIVVVYVDDILFFGNSKPYIDQTISKFATSITKLTEVAEVTRYIGIDIKRDLKNHTITMSQKPYQSDYVASKAPGDLPTKEIPLPSTIDYDIKGTEPSIQKEVGQLRYLADRTKPEIQAAVGILGSAAAFPSKEHVKGTVWLAQYLKGCLDDSIVFGGKDNEILLFGYSDASYLPRTKSRLGYCFYLNLESGAIVSRSFHDQTVSHSSCEVEIKAIDEAVRQVIWLRGFLEEITFKQLKPTVIYTDSQSAKTLIDSFHIGNRSAHLVMRLNYLHEQVSQGTIELKYINTDDQVADILTKLLPYPKFIKFKKFLLKGHDGILPVPIPKATPKPDKLKFIKKMIAKSRK